MLKDLVGAIMVLMVFFVPAALVVSGISVVCEHLLVRWTRHFLRGNNVRFVVYWAVIALLRNHIRLPMPTSALLTCCLMMAALGRIDTFAAQRHHPKSVKSQPSAHTAEEERDVAEALYRYLLSQARKNSRWEGVQVIFLSRNNKDPDAPLLRRFQNSPLPVKVVSVSRSGKRWWVEDKVTGQKGVILFVDRIRWINNTKIQVRGGFGLEGKSGMSATFHMLHQGSQWRVERKSDEDIS